MTQQSLITRLKAVGEAFGDLIELANTAMRQASNDGAEYDRAEELHDTNAALSDLRELIKEAEEKKPIAYCRVAEWTNGEWPEECFGKGWFDKGQAPLYTALGEKP